MKYKWHWLKHKWGKWTQYQESYDRYLYDGKVVRHARFEIRQWRKCEICGALKDEIVTYDGRLDPSNKR